MLCQNIKKIQLIYKDIFKKTYATTGLKWLVVIGDSITSPWAPTAEPKGAMTEVL